MFLDILLLFQHTAAACTGCTGCLLAWFLLPFLLGLLLGWWIWGAYKAQLEEKEAKILSLNKQLTEREKEYMDLKYKLESSESITTKIKNSLAECQAEHSTLTRQLREAEAAASVVEEVPEPLALVDAVEEVVEETPVIEEVVEETPIVAPLAIASTAAAVAVAPAPVEETPVPVDKEDDYLPCKAYIGHKVNDTRNNIAFFKHENGQFYFVLYGEDGQVRLRSEGFPTTKERDQELSGVNRFKDQESHYKRVAKGKYFMDILYDETGREVGRSCLQKIEEPVEEVAPTVVEEAAPVMAVAAVAPALVPTETDKEDDYLPCKEYIGHKINDQKNNIALFKHSNDQFYFVLYKANGEVQLRSEGFRTSQERDKELSGVIRFKDEASKYKRISKGKYFMDALYDETGREVGRSCLQKIAEPEEEPTVERVEPEVVERQIIKVRRTVNISGLEDLDGIGVVAQSKLKALGLGSMTALAASDEATLSNHFAGTDYNWRYWWMQAKYATSGDWAKYYSFQASKGKDIQQDTSTPVEPVSEPVKLKAEDTPIKEVRSIPPLGITRTTRTVKADEPTAKDAYDLYFTDTSLQVIEGVGPKIEKILTQGGYSTLTAVADASYDDLKKLLSKAGPRFRIHDPKSWSRQAQLASQHKWNDLIDYQKFLNKTIAGEESFSKVEKLMNRQTGYTKTEETDLKIIEGVGPKIEALLKAGGIYNWTDLSNASIDKLKLILQNAGSRYRLADPTTWPTQAGMAVRKEWTKLKEYQDLLQGGKDIS